MHGGGPALSRTLLEPLASRKAKEAHRGESPGRTSATPLPHPLPVSAGQVLPSAGAAGPSGPRQRQEVLTKCLMVEDEEAQGGHLIHSPCLAVGKF